MQEISQTFDTPDDIIFDYFQDVAFKNQSLGQSILGPAEIVAKITSEDLNEYRKKYYNAENIVFAAAGNVEHEELIESALKYFSAFPTKNTNEHKVKYNYTGGTFSDVRDLEQAHVIIGFEGVSSFSEDYYAMAIFSSILGGGMSSRLFQEIREKRGLVYSIYSFTSSYKQNGVFGIYAATSPEKISDLTSVASDELFKMCDEISEDEIKRTKTQFKASLLMSNENNSTSCEQIVNQTMIFGQPISNEEILKKVNAVSIDDVKKIVKKIVASKSSVVTVGKNDCSSVLTALKNSGINISN